MPTSILQVRDVCIKRKRERQLNSYRRGFLSLVPLFSLFLFLCINFYLLSVVVVFVTISC